MNSRERISRRLLISHNDLDGCCGGLLGELLNQSPQVAFDKKFQRVLLLDYDFEKDESLWNSILFYDEIIIVDLSLPEPFLKELLDAKKKVTIYDHHASSEYLKEYSELGIHDESRCGSLIFLEEYIVPAMSVVPMPWYHMVKLVDTYDRWQDDTIYWEDALILNRCLYRMKDYSILADSRAAYQEWFDFYKQKLTRLETWKWMRKELELNGRGVKRENEIYQQALEEIEVRVDTQGNAFGVVSMSGGVSLCARRLLDSDYGHLAYVIIINTYEDELGKLSIRSHKEGFDVTTLAPFGGHPASGGTRVSSEIVNFFFNNPNTCFLPWEEVGQNEDGTPKMSPLAIL